MHKKEHIAVFVEVIWDWFGKNKRELPWRNLSIENDTDRAYMVLVSEVMLQQTQVPRVVPIYRRFLEEFPSLSDLAEASNAYVLREWRGMGYNSRALRLRDAARTIIDDFDGVFPKEMDELLSIKGIGHYTAAAVRNFAFNLPTACIDTNIRRILHRTFIGPEKRDGTWKKDDAYLLKLADDVLNEALKHPPRLRSGQATTADWHAALMDFGSLVCTTNNPNWDICPLTAKELSKSSYKVKRDQKIKKQEPGREVGGRFIPNRIFRGKVVEELRDEISGLRFEDIGNRICIDWSLANHEEWLQNILNDLQKDQLVSKKRSKYVLH